MTAQPTARDALARRFEAEHERLFGTRLGDPIEIVDCWVTLTRPRATPDGLWAMAPQESSSPRSTAWRSVILLGSRVAIYDRHSLDSARAGPCLVEEPHSVTVVPTGAMVYPRLHHLIVEA